MYCAFLLLPWPLKIVVDHVILGEPIAADGAGFPGYMEPVMFFLATKQPKRSCRGFWWLAIMMVILWA